MEKIRIILPLLLLAAFFMSTQLPTSPPPSPGKYAIVIHGGAGNITLERIAGKEKLYEAGLETALNRGYNILEKGGTAQEAVVAAITFMEDYPLFNAGKGSVFTHELTNEMDASIMEGKTLNAGAVAGVTTIKNPVLAAKAVLTSSPHVMLSGKGAETFAREQKLELVTPEYFKTEPRWEQIQKIRDKEKTELDHGSGRSGYNPAQNDEKFGTVGAVAIDKDGNICAATSTGGMTNKRYGRIGDSPVIGAGTYANNKTCGISCTGHGEFFIRHAVAYRISALMELKGLSLEEACQQVVMKELKEAGGEGGVIGIDKSGNVAMVFNTTGMFRATRKEGSKTEIAILGK